MHNMLDVILARVSKYTIGCELTYPDVILLALTFNKIYILFPFSYSFL